MGCTCQVQGAGEASGEAVWELGVEGSELGEGVCGASPYEVGRLAGREEKGCES